VKAENNSFFMVILLGEAVTASWREFTRLHILLGRLTPDTRCPLSAKSGEWCSELVRSGQFTLMNSAPEQSDAPSFAMAKQFVERFEHPAAAVRRSGFKIIFSKLWVRASDFAPEFRESGLCVPARKSAALKTAALHLHL
jgi:hypothetical protein